jgi:hypothetical protein
MMQSGNSSRSLNQECDKTSKSEQVCQSKGPKSLVQRPQQEAVLSEGEKNEACLNEEVHLMWGLF